MQPRTAQPAHLKGSRGADVDDDELEWAALRLCAEHSTYFAGADDDYDTAAADIDARSSLSEWEWRRFRGEPERSEASYHYASPLPQALPTPNHALAAQAPNPPEPCAPVPSIPSPVMAFDAFEDETPQPVPRARRVWPVLAISLLGACALGTALTRQLVAKAEQQARIEQTLHKIQVDQSQGAAPGNASELSVAQPQAEVPSSETLAAFARLRQPSAANVVHTQSLARRTQPARRDAKTQPAVRPMKRFVSESDAAFVREPAEVSVREPAEVSVREPADVSVRAPADVAASALADASDSDATSERAEADAQGGVTLADDPLFGL